MSSPNEEIEKFENPYEEIANRSKKLVDEIREQEYERGMEDAWEMLKKIYKEDDISIVELNTIFGSSGFDQMILNYSAREAKEKIDNYIKKRSKKLLVGDEVIDNLTKKRYVIVSFVRVESMHVPNVPYKTCEPLVRLVGNDGEVWVADPERVKKTGRHFDEVEELFKKLKEDNR